MCFLALPAMSFGVGENDMEKRLEIAAESEANAICNDRFMRSFIINYEADKGRDKEYDKLFKKVIEYMAGDFRMACSSKKLHKRESKFAQRMVEACMIGCSSVLRKTANLDYIDQCRKDCDPLNKRLRSFHLGFVLGQDSLNEKCQPSSNISNLSRAASKIIDKAPPEKAKVEKSNTIKP